VFWRKDWEQRLAAVVFEILTAGISRTLKHSNERVAPEQVKRHFQQLLGQIPRVLVSSGKRCRMSTVMDLA